MTSSQKADPGFIARMLGAIERVGNKLPHPATLFAIFAGGTILLSGIAGLFHISVIHP
jgi:aminobenzoyl-glutamate transport protein